MAENLQENEHFLLEGTLLESAHGGESEAETGAVADVVTGGRRQLRLQVLEHLLVSVVRVDHACNDSAERDQRLNPLK